MRAPALWPGFDSRSRRHMWVEFVIGSFLAPRGFSPGTPVFPSPQKFLFDPEHVAQHGQVLNELLSAVRGEINSISISRNR